MAKGWKVLVAALVVGLVAVLAAYLWFAADNGRGLAKVHLAVEHQFPQVRHIDADALSAVPAEQLVIFDVREEDEFAVSHLKNAIRVDPEIGEQAFMQNYAARTKGKLVVFYCSVGLRSSDLDNRVGKSLIASGAKAAYNLKGGIFGWHNDRRPLFTNGGLATDYVHGYSRLWGRLIEDKVHIAYKLQPAIMIGIASPDPDRSPATLRSN